MHQSALQAPKASATVSMIVVRALVDAVEKAGVERNEFLRACALDASQLRKLETRVALRDVYRMCELALELTGDPALGLHWAEKLSATTFVPLSYLFAHSGSLRQGFESLARFGSLLSDEPSYELVQQGAKVTLRCYTPGDQPLPVQRFVAEMVLANFFRILGSHKVPGQPERACFAFKAPSYRQEYVRVFGAALCFEHAFTGIVFDSALLDLAPAHRDEDIHEALKALAERRVSRVKRHTPYALRVRELLVQRRWPERVNMSEVARVLGLSVRSLRRYLAAEGTSYGELESAAFATVATSLLRDKQRTIQETAYEMGFSDASTFHRAFKRATGTTPKARRLE